MDWGSFLLYYWDDLMRWELLINWFWIIEMVHTKTFMVKIISLHISVKYSNGINQFQSAVGSSSSLIPAPVSVWCRLQFQSVVGFSFRLLSAPASEHTNVAYVLNIVLCIRGTRSNHWNDAVKWNLQKQIELNHIIAGSYYSDIASQQVIVIYHCR